MEINENFLLTGMIIAIICRHRHETSMILTAQKNVNKGTLILIVTYAPANIHYPQDISLLNETREKLQTLIYLFCKLYSLSRPRHHGKRARKGYLVFAKAENTEHRVSARRSVNSLIISKGTSGILNSA